MDIIKIRIMVVEIMRTEIMDLVNNKINCINSCLRLLIFENIKKFIILLNPKFLTNLFLENLISSGYEVQWLIKINLIN